MLPISTSLASASRCTSLGVGLVDSSGAAGHQAHGRRRVLEPHNLPTYVAAAPFVHESPQTRCALILERADQMQRLRAGHQHMERRTGGCR